MRCYFCLFGFCFVSLTDCKYIGFSVLRFVSRYAWAQGYWGEGLLKVVSGERLAVGRTQPNGGS